MRIAALIELRELLARDLPGERQVASVAHHGLLALAAQDITQELLEFRIQRPARCAVEVDMDVAYQRIASILKARRARGDVGTADRKSTRLNSSHSQISYAVFCLKKKKKSNHRRYVYSQIEYHSMTTRHR